MKVAVSYLKSDDYKKCIEKIEQSCADYIHVDLCDGKYVPAKNFTIGEVTKLLKKARKPLDVHLMVMEPLKYIDALAMLNIETITIHPLACKDLAGTLDYISGIGLKVGLAINPDEDIELIKPYLAKIDAVLVMSVVPGKGGQAFIPSVLDKVDELTALKDNYHFITAIDGGINAESRAYLEDKDLDLLVSGSYITDSADYDEAINSLK